MRALAFGIASALMLANSAMAQNDKYTAKYMLPYCRDALNNKSPSLTIDGVLQGMCVGIVDGLEFIMSEYPPDEKDLAVCPASDLSLKEIVQAVITYIDARPERMNENFKKLAIEAIHDAWPCSTN